MLPCYSFISKPYGLLFFLKISIFCSDCVRTPDWTGVGGSVGKVWGELGNGIRCSVPGFVLTLSSRAQDWCPGELPASGCWVSLTRSLAEFVYHTLLFLQSHVVLCLQLKAFSKVQIHLFNSLWCSCFGAILSAWQWNTEGNGWFWFFALCCHAGLHLYLWWCGMV